MGSLIKNAGIALATVWIGFQLPVVGDMLRKAAQKPVA
jgi:hypothetical protein